MYCLIICIRALIRLHWNLQQVIFYHMDSPNGDHRLAKAISFLINRINSAMLNYNDSNKNTWWNNGSRQKLIHNCYFHFRGRVTMDPSRRFARNTHPWVASSFWRCTRDCRTRIRERRVVQADAAWLCCFWMYKHAFEAPWLITARGLLEMFKCSVSFLEDVKNGENEYLGPKM